MLYVDNCSAHNSNETGQTCLQNIRTVMKKFPANTTRVLLYEVYNSYSLVTVLPFKKIWIIFMLISFPLSMNIYRTETRWSVGRAFVDKISMHTFNLDRG